MLHCMFQNCLIPESKWMECAGHMVKIHHYINLDRDFLDMNCNHQVWPQIVHRETMNHEALSNLSILTNGGIDSPVLTRTVVKYERNVRFEIINGFLQSRNITMHIDTGLSLK